jgi:hypothetical protein
MSAPPVSEPADRDRLLMDAALVDFQAAIQAVPDGSAEDMLRDAMRRMVAVAEQHRVFLERLMTDDTVSQSAVLLAFTTRLLVPATHLLDRLKATGQLRPVSDLIIARTLVSLFMGIIVSERAMPQIARVALRVFNQRAWVDGMVDILLFGLLEDDAR